MNRPNLLRALVLSTLTSLLVVACAQGVDPSSSVSELRISQADVDRLAAESQLVIPIEEAAYLFDSSQTAIDFSRITLALPDGDVRMDDWMDGILTDTGVDLRAAPGGFLHLRMHEPSETASGDASSHELALSKCENNNWCGTLCDAYGCTTDCFYICRGQP